MTLNIEALQLEKHPALDAFLQAETPVDISAAYELLKVSQSFPYYPYGLRLYVTRSKISVYEISAAMGKLQHLKLLLLNWKGPEPEYRVDARPIAESIVSQTAYFYGDLMSEAIVNNQLEVIDYLAPSYYLAIKEIPYNHKLLRLAIDTGHLAVVNKILKLEEQNVKPHSFGNDLLSRALEGGYLDIVNRFLEFTNVQLSIYMDKEKLLFSAVRGNSLAVFNRFNEFVDIGSLIILHGKDLLGIAISISSLDILNRILEFKEAREIMIKNTDGLLANALRFGRLDIINRLLEFKGVRKELIARQDELLSLAIKSQNFDIFRNLILQVNYIAICHDDPKKDLLCLAALSLNEDIIDALLANKTVLQLAKSNNFYRAFVGERLVLRATALGIDLKPKISKLPAFASDGVEEISSAGQKRQGQFFHMGEVLKEHAEDKLEKTKGQLKKARF